MFTIRRATVADANALAQARVAFQSENKHLSDETIRELREANYRYFTEYLPREELAVWVAEADGAIIGTGAVVYFTALPRPNNLSGKDAYLLQMYTVPAWRRRGIGTAILTEIIASVKQTEARCIILYAMDDGRSLYEKAGFQYRPDNMRLTW